MNIGGVASILNEGIDNCGCWVGIHGSLTQTSDSVDARSTESTCVEIAGGGEEGGEIGSEGGFGDGIGE